jgi:hypothetical protein
MTSHGRHQEPSAPPMYPDVDNIRPVPPVRSEFTRHPHEESLLPPIIPERMDKPSSRPPTDDGLRRVNIEIMIAVFLKVRLHNYCNTLFILFTTKQNQLLLLLIFLLRMIMREILVI